MGSNRDLRMVLGPESHPLPADGDHPFWNRPDPKPHWSDQGEHDTAIQALDSGLRFASTQANSSKRLSHHIDLRDRRLICDLDFRHAEVWETIPAQNIYGTSFQALKNVRVKVDTEPCTLGMLLSFTTS